MSETASTVPTNVANGPTSNSPLSFTVPSNAVLGNTTMRVTTKYATNASSCENGHDAEVEDYTINVLGSLSVDEFALGGIRLYPNPTTSELNIHMSNSDDLPNGYKVYNMLGQLVTEKTIESNFDLKVNTSAMSKGMYFIKITKGDKASTLSFIKK